MWTQQITPQLSYNSKHLLWEKISIWTTSAAIFCVLKTRERQSFKAGSRAFTVQNTEILTLRNLHYHSNYSTRTTTFRQSQIKDISKLRPWGSFTEYLKFQDRPPHPPFICFKVWINHQWICENTNCNAKKNCCPKSMYGTYENTGYSWLSSVDYSLLWTSTNIMWCILGYFLNALWYLACLIYR